MDTTAGMNNQIPMTSIQEAYWVGRLADSQMGGVSTHTFEELDATGIDLHRLESSWNQLIKRHDMMRARINTSGYIEIIDEVPWYSIETDDLSDLPESESTLRLALIRERMREEVLAADTLIVSAPSMHESLPVC